MSTNISITASWIQPLFSKGIQSRDNTKFVDAQGHDILTDQSGNYILGLYDSRTSEDYISIGDDVKWDILLEKYSHNGSKIWSSIYGSTDNDTPRAFGFSSDGSIYSLIKPFGAVNGIEPQGGSMVIRHNKNGDIDLTESLNNSTSFGDSPELLGIGATNPDHMAIDSADNIYLAGSTWLENYSGFISKYDSAMNKVWTRYLDYPINNYDHTIGYSNLSILDNGDLVLGGETHKVKSRKPYLDFVEGGVNSYICRHTPSGEKKWCTTYQSGKDIFIKDLVESSSSSIYIYGTVEGDLDEQTSNGMRDLFVSKLDEKGSKKWTYLIGSIANDHATAMAIDSRDNIYLTGYTQGSIGETPHSDNETDDPFIIKLDKNGILKSVNIFDVGDSRTAQISNDIAIGKNNSLMITGLSHISEPELMGEDGFIARFVETTAKGARSQASNSSNSESSISFHTNDTIDLNETVGTSLQISTNIKPLDSNENTSKDASVADLGIFMTEEKTNYSIYKPNRYKIKFADKITNFNSTTDSLEINTDSFGVDGSATFTAGKNKKTVKKKLSKQDFDFLYDQKKGGLYFNENGSAKGFGEGGIIAILKGSPDITSDNLEFI